MNIVTLCTGNVARSVMLGYMLTSIADDIGAEWSIRTAGTHVTEGSAMSGRTREALTKLDRLGDHRYGAHRSHQLTADDAEWADVILAAEADNVDYVRANLTAYADRTVQIAQLVGLSLASGRFGERLRVAVAQEPAKEFDVLDPAGGDQVTYDRCARQLWDLATSFATLVQGSEVVD